MITPSLTRKLVVYIAGPFRGPSAWAIEQNIRRAEELALDIWRLGAAVLCPHTNTRFFQGAAPDAIWLDGDLELLRRCDVILMTKAWHESVGARVEHDFAVQLGMRSFYEDVPGDVAEIGGLVQRGWLPPAAPPKTTATENSTGAELTAAEWKAKYNQFACDVDDALNGVELREGATYSAQRIASRLAAAVPPGGADG